LVVSTGEQSTEFEAARCRGVHYGRLRSGSLIKFSETASCGTGVTAQLNPTPWYRAGERANLHAEAANLLNLSPRRDTRGRCPTSKGAESRPRPRSGIRTYDKHDPARRPRILLNVSFVG
jgi:hypothetical protein